MKIQSRQFIFAALTAFLLIGSARAEIFTVTNTNDGGANSLRQAILNANAAAGVDTIAFGIGSGIQTISPLTPFPIITDPVVIDGTTQPGFAGVPLIVISGSNITTSASGLRVTGGSSLIRGLVINGFRNGSGISLTTAGGNTIVGNYVGIDATGMLRRANNSGIGISSSSNNVIGGSAPSERNVISGSNFDNIAVGNSANTRIKGNYIGTNAQGTASIPGSGYGINDFDGNSVATVIGGTLSGEGNVISGNGQAGMYLGGKDTLVQGNYIGTDATGTQRVPNSSFGIYITTGINVLIGGTIPAARNIISGNDSAGIRYIPGNNPSTKIQGNYIGTDFTGTIAVRNAYQGIEVNGALLIGGTEPGAGNLISGNGSRGILLRSNNGVTFTTVQGNLIGTDATGLHPLEGDSTQIGVEFSCNNNLVGGNQAAAGNIISGNLIGIQIGGSTTATVAGNIVRGNFIGSDKSGKYPIPNINGGVIISAGLNNSIGGVNAGEENVIAFNNGKGVSVTGLFDQALGNAIRRNSIFLNNGLGIDLGTDGIGINDACDGDTGANNLQNYPVLSSATSANGITTISGNLNSVANATYTIDFYASPTYNASGNGEGKIYLGSATAATDAGCNAPLNVNFNSGNTGGLFITATATDSLNNTSEFSTYIRATGTSRKPDFDFDGDGKTDLSVFRPSNGVWYLQQSQAGFAGISFGLSGDVTVPADYDGDGKTDVAVYRSGTWYLQRSSQGFTGIAFGISSDVPVPTDFDGDGKSELAVYRPSNGGWYIYKLTTNQTNAVQFGISEDKPVPADYDGDGRADVAVFRPSNGTWYLQRSQLGFTGIAFGQAGDKPVAADYDADGRTDVAVFRPSNGTWYLQRSQLGFTGIQFGIPTDLPTPADYDGDGKADVAVFRDGTWYQQRSVLGFTGVAFGGSGDQPIPNAYVR